MDLIGLRKELKDGKNVLFYQQEIRALYDLLKDDYLCIYFNEPLPIKLRLIQCLEKVGSKKNVNLNRFTIPELVNMIFAKINFGTLIIMFNNFDMLTKRAAQVYQHLNSRENVLFICSFANNFSQDVYPFFKSFLFVNKEEYNEKTGKNEVNVTYGVYFLLSVLCFFIYIKTASSMVMAMILIGGAWFALMIFRTFTYAGGRI
jgi:hypothetical protein